MWLKEKYFFTIALSLFCFTNSIIAFPKNSLRIKDANGGWNCLTCTVIVSLIEQLAIINNSTIEQSFDKLCDMLPPGVFQDACQSAVVTCRKVYQMIARLLNY
jgi:hypothetical protein